LLTGRGELKVGRISIVLRVFARVFKAAIAVASAFCGLWINGLKIVDDSFDGMVQTVEIKAVKANFLVLALVQMTIVGAEPFEKKQDILIAPHPEREALETIERFLCCCVAAYSLNIPIDTIGIGPIGFDRDGCEAFFSDQALGDDGSRIIKLMSSM